MERLPVASLSLCLVAIHKFGSLNYRVSVVGPVSLVLGGGGGGTLDLVSPWRRLSASKPTQHKR